MSQPDPFLTFPWTPVTGGMPREVRLFAADPVALSQHELADLIDGCDHAHDEDTLEVIMSSFAHDHGLEVATFITRPDHRHDLDDGISVGFRPQG
ncbi:MAG: hypothetical protein M3O94_08960 [Actinomycetota bacterium]|nr:hypothetical protein [Actinomycetota bacterium]